jgi:chromosome segregation ATPase
MLRRSRAAGWGALEDVAMPDREIEQLNEKLEKLAEDLRKRTREFHETGGFTEVRSKFLRQIEKENDALRARIDQAAKNKDSWGYVKASLWRDYEAAAHDFSEFVALVVSQPMKKL